MIVPIAAALLLAAGCARTRVRTLASFQTGIASWYGPNFHGKATSNREVYDMYDLTAAHQTLPFGTRVMVTNLDNGRAVQVRINDRGPFVGNRIIDLSYAAARLLDMVGPGTAPVRLDIVSGAVPAGGPCYIVQLGSFTDLQNARQLKERLGNKYGPAFISEFVLAGRTYYRVRLPSGDRTGAEALAARLNADGFPVLICESNLS